MLVSALFSIIAALYLSLADIYGFMISMTNGSIFRTDVLQQTSQNIYILVGIFMLFRVAVSLLNMVIDPDKISDKQAGAGKLISRILVSIVLLLTLPTLIFPFAKRLQDAIINPSDGSGSLLFRIFDLATSGDYEYTKTYSDEKDTTSPTPTKDSLVCYYFRTNFTQSGGSYNYKVNTSNFYKIMFTTTASGTKINNGSNYFKFATGKEYYSTEENAIEFNFVSSYSNITNDKKSTNAYSSCPKYFKVSGSTLHDVNFTGGSNDSGNDFLTLGGKDLPSLVNTLGSLGNNTSGSGWKTIFPLEGIIANGSIATTIGEENKDVYNLIMEGDSFDSSGNGVVFARSALKPFIHCIKEKEKCEKTKTQILSTVSANKEMVKLIKNDNASIDNFLALIIGLALIVFIIWMCLEIAVRGIKMILLEFISPIAVIAYMNPNDEIFKKWSKMYIGAYLDLFIKLFAISLVTLLLGALNIFDGEKNVAEVIIWMLALFIFAMTVPNFLSEIFGIKDMAGGFKDTWKLAKQGLGTGVGALAGGVGGLLTGAIGEGGSFGNAAKGFLGGMGRGAKAGWKGDLKGGLSKQWQRGRMNRDLVADRNEFNKDPDKVEKNGGPRTALSDFAGIQESKYKNMFGYDDAYTKAEKTKKQIEEAQQDINRVEDMMDKKVLKYQERYAAVANAKNILNKINNNEKVYDASGKEITFAQAEGNLEKAKKQARKQYAVDLTNGMFKEDIDEIEALKAANSSTRSVSADGKTYIQGLLNDDKTPTLTQKAMKQQTLALDQLEKFVSTKTLSQDVALNLNIDANVKQTISQFDKTLKNYIETNATNFGLGVTLAKLNEARQSGQEETIKLAEKEYNIKLNETLDRTRINLNTGDNLDSIAKANGTTVQKLMELNKLTNDTVIANQELKVSENSDKTYTVKASKDIYGKEISNLAYAAQQLIENQSEIIERELINYANNSDFSKIVSDSVGKIKDELGQEVSKQKIEMSGTEATHKAAEQEKQSK